MNKSEQQTRTRDFFHKVQEIKRKFKAQLGMLKEQHGNTLTKQNKRKKRWRQYTE